MAERLNAAVLKTVEGNTSGGSNPSLPATPLKTSKKTDPQLIFSTQYKTITFEIMIF